MSTLTAPEDLYGFTQGQTVQLRCTFNTFLKPEQGTVLRRTSAEGRLLIRIVDRKGRAHEVSVLPRNLIAVQEERR